jgi:hypothetical protein
MNSNNDKKQKHVSVKNILICDKIFFHSQTNMPSNVLDFNDGTDRREAFVHSQVNTVNVNSPNNKE